MCAAKGRVTSSTPERSCYLSWLTHSILGGLSPGLVTPQKVAGLQCLLRPRGGRSSEGESKQRGCKGEQTLPALPHWALDPNRLQFGANTLCWDMNSVLKYSQATSYLEHSKRLCCQQACPAARQFWSFFSSQTTRLPVALAPLWISEPHRSTQQSKVQELCEAVCPQIAKIDTSQSVPRAFMINQRTCRPAVIMSTMSSALFWKQSVEEKRR